jgi:hypothetical protein
MSFPSSPFITAITSAKNGLSRLVAPFGVGSTPCQQGLAIKTKILASLSLVPLVFAVSAQAIDIGFEFGVGINTGGDHTDAVEEAYRTDSDGLGMFIELHAGVPIGVTENFVVKPQLSLSFSSVSVEAYRGATETYVDTIVIPGVAAEYYINGYKNNSVFLGAELGSVGASSGSDKDASYGYKLAGDGSSFGIYGGYASGSGAKFSLGYRSIPVEVEYNLNGKKESKNFGGAQFLFSYAFYVD